MDNVIRTHRSELKFYIDLADYRRLRCILAGALKPDDHADSNGNYWIRSLYFDDMRNGDYYDKMSGMEARKKIRIRLYDVSQDRVKLEIKNKRGDKSLKETAFIDARDARALVAGDRNVLLRYGNAALNRAYYMMARCPYRPATVVDYEREAYVSHFQHVRITFDKNIRGGMGDFRIFNRNLSLLPVFDRYVVVLEVKYDRFLPGWIAGALSRCRSAAWSAIGKYCLSRGLE